MNEQLHLTHRADYERGRNAGQSDFNAGNDYRPRDGSPGLAGQAYGLGYADGWGNSDEKGVSSGRPIG